MSLMEKFRKKRISLNLGLHTMLIDFLIRVLRQTRRKFLLDKKKNSSSLLIFSRTLVLSLLLLFSFLFSSLSSIFASALDYKVRREKEKKYLCPHYSKHNQNNRFRLIGRKYCVVDVQR